MKPIDRNQLPEISGTSFAASKLRTGATLWVGASYLERYSEAGRPASLYKDFYDRFAYCMPDSVSLRDLEFERDCNKLMWAERYGGRGIGWNAGGARVGNSDGFQIKGIGRNPLAGTATEFLHSYGALAAAEAMYEAIYATLLNKIMPLGAAEIYGIILTGPEAAYHRFDDNDGPEASRQSRCWGALLVREICRRPSHFLPAPSFVPADDQIQLAPDLARVRAVNRVLFQEAGSARQAVARFGEFLGNCANQFAYAKVMRLAHGALTASNLCMDGRWIDLSRTSFVPANENNGALLPSAMEADYIAMIVEELLYTFSKFNRLQLNPKVLIDYYNDQFSAYMDLHVAELLGIDFHSLGNDSAEAYELVCEQVLKVIGAGKTYSLGPVNAKSALDQVQLLVLGIYSALDGQQLPEYFYSAFRRIPGFDWKLTAGAFRQVLRDAFDNQNIHTNYSYFVLWSALRAMKAALLQGVFYKKRIDDQLGLLVLDGEPADFRDFMQGYESMIAWIAPSENQERLWLFRGHAVEVCLERNTGFVLTRKGMRRALSASALAGVLAEIADEELNLCEFNFKPYLADVMAVCVLLENSNGR